MLVKVSFETLGSTENTTGETIFNAQNALHEQERSLEVMNHPVKQLLALWGYTRQHTAHPKVGR